MTEQPFHDETAEDAPLEPVVNPGEPDTDAGPQDDYEEDGHGVPV